MSKAEQQRPEDYGFVEIDEGAYASSFPYGQRAPVISEDFRNYAELVRNDRSPITYAAVALHQELERQLRKREEAGQGATDLIGRLMTRLHQATDPQTSSWLH